VFWIAFWLAVALMGAKIYHIRGPDNWGGREVNRYVTDVAIVTAADVVFAIGVGLVGWGVMSLCASRPRCLRIARIGLLGFAVLSVLYGVISARIFEYLRTPLSYPLIYLMGDMGNMRSSLSVYATPVLISMLIGVPVAFLLLVVFSERYLPIRSSWIFRGLQALTIMGVLALFFFSRREVAHAWGARHEDRRIADNPHYVFWASCIKELLGGEIVTLSDAFAPDDLRDFQMVSERPAGEGQPTAGLKRGPRNVILIVCESVGTQFLSVYGAKYKTWPRMQAEAQSSLILENYYSHITNTANSHVNWRWGDIRRWTGGNTRSSGRIFRGRRWRRCSSRWGIALRSSRPGTMRGRTRIIF